MITNELDPLKARLYRRAAAELLAIVAANDGAQELCRLRDLGEGGARLRVCLGEERPVGATVRVELLEAGLHGAVLVLQGRVAWAREEHVGIEWTEADPQALGALLKLCA